MNKTPVSFKNASYELFIAVLSILTLINLLIYYLFPGETTTVVLFMNGLLSLVFLGDFFYRLFSAPSKSGYIIREFGWADLLSCVPLPEFKLFRIFRLYLVGRTARKEGSRFISHSVRRNLPQSAFISLTLLIILLLEFGSIAVFYFEIDTPGGNILTAEDAIWYTFVTITTVGYGDQYPVSLSGRIMGMLIMIAGVGLFGTLTGYLSNIFLRPRDKNEPGDGKQPNQETATVNNLENQLKDLRSLHSRQQAILDELEEKIDLIENLIQQSREKTT